MNLIAKSLSFLFIFLLVVSLLILNIQWGKKNPPMKNSPQSLDASLKKKETIFVTVFELKKNVFMELEKDFKKRKKVRLSYE